MNFLEHSNAAHGLMGPVLCLVGGLLGPTGLWLAGVSGFIVLPMAAIIILLFTIIVIRDRRRNQANRAASERR